MYSEVFVIKTYVHIGTNNSHVTTTRHGGDIVPVIVPNVKNLCAKTMT